MRIQVGTLLRRIDLRKAQPEPGHGLTQNSNSVQRYNQSTSI